MTDAEFKANVEYILKLRMQPQQQTELIERALQGENIIGTLGADPSKGKEKEKPKARRVPKGLRTSANAVSKSGAYVPPPQQPAPEPDAKAE